MKIIYFGIIVIALVIFFGFLLAFYNGDSIALQFIGMVSIIAISLIGIALLFTAIIMIPQAEPEIRTSKELLVKVDPEDNYYVRRLLSPDTDETCYQFFTCGDDGKVKLYDKEAISQDEDGSHFESYVTLSNSWQQ